MDHEGSGDGIDAGDLKQALQRHGIRVTIVQAAQLIKEIDDDGNGSINFEEFFEAVQAHFERQYNKELTNDLIAEKESATMAAARAGYARAARTLLEAGADCTITREDGATALSLAEALAASSQVARLSPQPT